MNAVAPPEGVRTAGERPATKRPPLTRAQKDAIGHLRETKGWSYARIAKEVGAGSGAVSWFCLMEGIRAPGRPGIRPRRAERKTTMRNGRPVRSFTAADDATLRAMSLAGSSKAEMCRTLGRKNNSIAAALARLAMLDEALEGG